MRTIEADGSNTPNNHSAASVCDCLCSVNTAISVNAPLYRLLIATRSTAIRPGRLIQAHWIASGILVVVAVAVVAIAAVFPFHCIDRTVFVPAHSSVASMRAKSSVDVIGDH